MEEKFRLIETEKVKNLAIPYHVDYIKLIGDNDQIVKIKDIGARKIEESELIHFKDSYDNITCEELLCRIRNYFENFTKHTLNYSFEILACEDEDVLILGCYRHGILVASVCISIKGFICNNILTRSIGLVSLGGGENLKYKRSLTLNLKSE